MMATRSDNTKINKEKISLFIYKFQVMTNITNL